MKYDGSIIRVQHGRDGVTLIIDTPVGMRGVDIDNALWSEILVDFELKDEAAIVGWMVEYDPAHGDLEIIGPAETDETPT